MKRISNYILFCLVLIWASCNKYESPSILTVTPEFGSEGTLITIEGANFEDITSLTFNEGVAADFNPSYGSANAVLFRVPEDAPLGENIITIETKGGTVTTPFRVTLLPPSITEWYPKSAQVGETVTFLGENFFEPIEVLFFDSIAGNIVYLAEDSLVVEIPQGVEKGPITVRANGGDAVTNTVFFTTTDILINDFDGNGLRAETNKWLFYGSILQNVNTAVQNTIPAPLDNNFMKLSGSGPTWIGGTESHSSDVADFNVFPITSDLNNTFLEMDLNNNGRNDTQIILIMGERGGSSNDFTYNQDVSEDGWNHLRIPLTRFEDLDGIQIDPQIIRVVKIHLSNSSGSTSPFEVNVDNLKFVQVN